jgi:hypothetical protein
VLHFLAKPTGVMVSDALVSVDRPFRWPLVRETTCAWMLMQICANDRPKFRRGVCGIEQKFEPSENRTQATCLEGTDSTTELTARLGIRSGYRTTRSGVPYLMRGSFFFIFCAHHSRLSARRAPETPGCGRTVESATGTPLRTRRTRAKERLERALFGPLCSRASSSSCRPF